MTSACKITTTTSTERRPTAPPSSDKSTRTTTSDESANSMSVWLYPLEEPGVDSWGGVPAERRNFFGLGGLTLVEIYMDIWSFTSVSMTLMFLFILALLFIPTDEQPMGTRALVVVLGYAVVVLVTIALGLCRIACVRTNVRERYGIPGSVKNDWQVALLQPTRSLRQMRRHIERARELEREQQQSQ